MMEKMMKKTHPYNHLKLYYEDNLGEMKPPVAMNNG